MPIDPALVSTITVPQLASLGLTPDTLLPHQVVGGVLKKATLAAFTAYFQANLALINKIIIIKNQFDLIEDGTGTGNYYLKYTDAGGLAITAGIRPYSISSVQGTHEYGIPPILEDDDLWDFPRIYGFNNSTQTITIYAI